jgi:hypothetical protein
MRTIAALVGLSFAAHAAAFAGAYVFADTSGDVNTITHVPGYAGAGGHLVVTVGIHPASPNALEMVTPLRNALRTWTGLVASTGNLQSDANLLSNQFDFETVLLHEVGHALGITHPNLASESALASTLQDGTKARKGPNNVFNVNLGGDAIAGSGDDLRLDDLNLYWFRIGNNNPVAALPVVVDKTTYSRSLANLPSGHTFAANSGRLVLGALGIQQTEGVMQQGSVTGEAQRTLTSEDIAAIRLAMAGIDELQGTADDYTFALSYVGLTTAADIVVDMDSTKSSFAQTQVQKAAIPGSATHFAIDADTTGGFSYVPILFSENINWYFNPISNAFDPANVFVDFARNENGTGSITLPFDNLADGLAAVEPGGVIHIAGGTSAETFSGLAKITQAVRLQRHGSGGPAQIGVQ